MVSPGRRTRSTGVDIVWANPADRGIAKRPTQSAAAVIVRVIGPPPSFDWSIRILYFNLSVSQGARSSIPFPIVENEELGAMMAPTQEKPISYTVQESGEN